MSVSGDPHLCCAVVHGIVLKTFELQLQDWRKCLKQYALRGILQQHQDHGTTCVYMAG